MLLYPCSMTDGTPNEGVAGLARVMNEERDAERVHVTFVACTDVESKIAFLNKWSVQLSALTYAVVQSACILTCCWCVHAGTVR